MRVGANFSQNKTEFTVWAPNQNQVSLVLPKKKETLKMSKEDDGYWKLTVDDIKPQTPYLYRLSDNKDRPDPASHFQPDGVFGTSAVVNHSSYVWKDSGWRGIRLEDMIMYELHVGTFTKQGTFDAAKSRARELSKTGINAVELMPVSQFSGARNWGYDAVFPFAVQNSYGGPDELKKLVDEFHANGVAVILDVVYNHLGPEGNFIGDFGPYLLFERMSPWGPSINFDGQQSLPVRNFFIENSFYWFQHYHIDGLRLDAIYAITDNSPKHILAELSETIEKTRANQKKLILVGENDRVDPKIISQRKEGGYGLDAVWHDNLHHAIHALLTGERNWYYSSFGTLRELKGALQEEKVNCDQISPLRNPESCADIRVNSKQLVVFSQNHDQIGNRPLGERLMSIAGFEAAKLAAGIVILSQYTPMLFMGEEYGEDAPFLFFTDFSDKLLGEKVSSGRKREIKKNGWTDESLDPQNHTTFAHSKIDWGKRASDKGRKVMEYYQTLIGLRKEFANSDPNKCLRTKFLVSRDELLLIIQKETSEAILGMVASFGKQDSRYRFPFEGGSFVKVLDSADIAWLGPGSAVPQTAKLGDEHTICAQSLSVFLNREEEK